MANTLEELTQRVARLEQIIEERFPAARTVVRQRDWQNSIGKITDDAVTQEVIAEALRLREEERAALSAGTE